MPFAIGQRWISDTEQDLGLGTVVEVNARTVTLLYTASEENRVYSRSDAPITRVIFNPGDEITSHEDWIISVDRVEENEGLLVYHGTRQDSGEEVALREIFLSNQIRFNKPQDKLFAGQIDRMDNFALRYRARLNLVDQQKSALRGLTGMRADLIPHQLYIAREVGRRHAPRVLLADEVGLGKTIEAGMIIHQQILSGRAGRVLILVPDTLQYQWLVEMMRRFNLHFSIFDEERCAEADAENPFDTEQLVLCSLNFIRKSKKRFEQALDAQWDLLVVDEAHHLIWDEETPSREYQVVEALASEIPGVLLLTATPEQLGHQSHFARLRLLDPNRFFDYQAFVNEEAQYQPVADAVSELLSTDKLSNEACNSIDELLSEQDVEPLLRIVNADNLDQDAKSEARAELITNLMDRHGTGRVLFRNTRAGVKGFPMRHLNMYPLDMPEQYHNALKVATIMNKRLSSEEKVHNVLYPEKLFQIYEGDQASWWNFDPRVLWLMDFLKNNREQKVLVICVKAETAIQLEQVLREKEGIRGTVFHEGMSILERDKAAAYFAEQESGAQVLLCSEIGSEGRNFQFSNQLVMFDLPLNPDLLEQRIGRLDRIGQQRDIEIHVPYMQGSVQGLLATWFDRGLQAFEETCPTGRAIFDKVYPELIELFAADTPDMDALESIIETSNKTNQQLKQQLEQGRDRLLEMNSNGGEEAKALVQDIRGADKDHALANFAISLFDVIGLDQSDKGRHVMRLKPSEHMLVPSYPGLPSDGAFITFDRTTALSREDLQFISWEHPMIQGGIDLLLAEGVGASAVSLLKSKVLPAGSIFLEMVYVVEAQVPKSSGIDRFLPPTPIRILLDSKGKNIADQVEFEAFHRQLSPVNRHVASKMVTTIQSMIHALISKGDKQIAPFHSEVLEEAQAQMQQTLRMEYDRLQALKAVNPNIRDEELTQIEEQISTLTHYIKQAQVHLDSLRLIIVSPN